MILILHFFFGVVFAFAGSITPSMLNMTALKISLEKNKKEANFYALGVAVVVVIQAYLAIVLTKYITENPSFLESLEKVGIVIFISLSYYFYRESNNDKKPIEIKKTSSNKPFLKGITLSALNMFSIPFFCATTATLEMFNLFIFDTLPIFLFVIGSLIGTFCILALYVKYAKKIKQKTGKITNDINLILSFITGIVAVFTILKIVFLNN
jgi:threonine/homoserine/homoserine lactone efflux protein